MSRIKKFSRSFIGITGFAMFGLLMTAIACHWSLSARVSVQDSARKYSGKVVVRGKVAATYQPETKIYNAAASTITVNSLEDGAPANDGKCTLREAMLNAEANNQSGSTDCVAGNGDDTINFSVTGIINLTTGLPITFSSFSIAGPGPDLLTVRGADFSEKSVFRFRSGSTINLKTVSVSGLKITNGYAKFNDSEGGAIYNNFVLLSVDNCDISGNVAFRGGGIYSNSGTVTITRSTISNNTADDGGGIYTHAAQVTIVESTISGNKAGDRGGGIKYGDICCLNRNLVITNSTISGNQASRGSAIEFNRLTMLLTNCTITNNSTTTSTDGAISMTSPFDPSQTISTQLKNTLVVGNTGRNFATAATASFISMGNNLDSDGTSGFVNNNNGNLVGTIAAPIDAKLGPLANNGGPTQTHALLPGSPAINTGTAAGAPSTDQRGVSRPFGGGVDIGAFELVPPMVVNSLADGAPANNGQCTLREALINANNNNQSGSTDCVAGGGPDTITFGVTGTINLTSALPNITDSLNIAGSGANQLIVRRDTGGDYRIFTIGSGNMVGIAGLTITGGSLPASEGGGILNAGSLTLTDCAVTDNYANGGGGIMNNGSLAMTGCTISRNTSNFDGGGLYNLGNATANLTNCTFSGNVGTSSGIATGAGSGETVTTLLTNCTLSAHSIGDTVIKNINFGGGLNVKTQLRNTLVAGNDVVNFAIGAGTTLTSLGGNFDSDGSSGFSDGIVGTAQFKLDANLGPLANNGGSTQTHALAPYSPAINAGIATGAPATDQRGFSRPYGGGVDIGAFELHALYVNAALGNDANNGTSFLSPFKTVAKGIATASDGDVVFVGTGTYPENNLVINKNVSIQGAGAALTVVDGKQLNRVFTIPSGQTVTFTDLTIANGSVATDVGGGVLNSGTLTVTNCAITGNSGLGGAGIENRGSLTMTGSTVSGNTAVLDGSGVRNEGNANASLTNCTISGNTNTGVFQSTVYNVATAGTALLVLTNCTVTANTAGQIIKNQNTGGAVITTQLRNTLVAGNSGENFSNINTTPASLTNSLDSDGTSGATNGVGGNLVGTAANKLNAKLGPLANNGGPTQTHALLRGSPAIDAGSNFQAPATDQRGLPREKDGNGDGLVAVDIGAYELSYRFVNVATGNDNNSGLTPTSPHKTLARAITVAGDGEILILAAGTYPENNLGIAKTLSFEGAGAGQTIIDGQQLNRVFSITQSGLNIGFSKLTIRGGKAPATGDDYDGGGIMSASDLTLTDCALVNNEARQIGGAVYLYLANGTFTGCTFSGNKAGLGGGAIVLLANTGNMLQLINSTVSGNTALGQGAGGGILNVPGGTLEVINSTIADNTGAAAAGIYTATSASVTTATTRLRNSILANSNANLQKGVVSNDDVFTAGGPATITSLGNNLASDDGGGFLTASGDQLNKDAKLSPLANNGGPTQTHLLLCGSPAINAGSNAGAPGTDQRGVARPKGGTVDIGAVEGDYSVSIVQTPLPNGKVGTPYNAGIYATAATTPLPLIFTATTPLPAGLRLDLTQIGFPIITGTPTAAVSNFGFTLMAVSLLEPGKQGCFNYTITIDPACPTITINPATLPAGQLGQQYNQQLTQTGGTGSINWSKTGDLPGNVSLNPATGLLSGAPTTSGTFNFSVTATDANGCASAPKAYSLVIVQCPAITINPATLPGGQIGLQYSQQLTQTGGTGTLMWSFAGGLPTGVTMDLTTGLISGKPTVSGTFNFSVAVKDANGCMSSTPKAYSLVIAPCPIISITPASLSPGMVGAQFSQLLTANGGTAPYTFSVKAGSTLPPGLNLSGNTLTGSPTLANSFTFTIEVTDEAGCTGTQSYTLLINPAITSNGLQFYPLAKPMRLLDTRPADERPGPAFDLPGARLVGEINGGTPRTQNARVSFDGLTVPANAKAIVGTATVVNYPGAGQYTGTGNVTFYPSNRPKPEVSNLNYAANQTISNGFTVALGDDGAFRIFCYSDVHLVIDVVGYYAPTGAGGLYFHPLPRPLRALETRPQTFFPGCETPRVKLQAGSTRTLQGQFSCEGITIPNSAKALVGNLTSVNAESNGEATVYAGDIAPLPLANTLSYVSTQAIPNAFVTRLSNTGNYNLFVSQTTDMLVDLTGYFSAEASDLNGQGLLLTLLETPIRKLETRPEMFYPGCITPRAPLAGNSETVIPALGTCDGVTIPATARALIGNATVVNFLSQGSGNVTMYPTAANRPEASNLNYVANQVIPNAFTVGLSADGKFTVYVFSTIHLLIDVTGYYAP